MTNIPATRVCSQCKTEKPLTTDYFYRRKSRKCSFFASCIVCERESSNRRYAKNYQKPRPIKTDAERAEYQEKLKQRHRDYRKRNAAKISERERAQRAANPEKEREYRREYRKKNAGRMRTYFVNYRARKRGLPVIWNEQHQAFALEYFHHVCAVCSSQLRDLFGDVQLHFDHWHPLNQPGCPGTVPTNMLPLCDHCNHMKHDIMPDVWLSRHYKPAQVKIIMKRINDYFASVKPDQNEREPD